MADTLKRRVESLLAAKKLTPSAADTLAELPRGYTRDILADRKQQPRPARLALLAAVLDCDVDYLMMRQKTPRVGMPALPFGGACIAGVWKEPGAPESRIPFAPYEADPRFPEDSQSIFAVYGPHAEGLGIGDGSLLIVTSATQREDLVVGDIVVIRRTRSGTVETSVAVIEDRNGKTTAVRRPSQTGGEVIEGEWELVGRALTAIRNLA